MDQSSDGERGGDADGESEHHRLHPLLYDQSQDVTRLRTERHTDPDLATSRIFACPEGITRATIIEICAAEKIRCIETDLSPVDVYGVDEIFRTGTTGELAGVVKVDNHLVGDGKVGEMTKRLSELYAKRTATECISVVD